MDNIISWILFHPDCTVRFENMSLDNMNDCIGVRLINKHYTKRYILSMSWFKEPKLWSLHTLLDDMYADIKAKESEDNKND